MDTASSCAWGIPCSTATWPGSRRKSSSSSSRRTAIPRPSRSNSSGRMVSPMRTSVLVATAVLALAAFVDPSLPIAAGPGVAYAQSPGFSATGPGRMSIDVQGAEIRTVIRSIAEFSKRNIITGKDVKGQVSVQLKDVPWRDALQSVLRTQGLDMVEEGGIIRVDTPEKLQAEVLARETNEAR